MQLGNLNRQITFQSASVSRSATYAAAKVSYSDFATVWASVTFASVSSPESVTAGAVQSTQRLRIICRYIDGLTNTMRIKDGTRFYQILDWNVIGRNEGIRITAAEFNEGRA